MNLTEISENIDKSLLRDILDQIYNVSNLLSYESK